MLFRSCYNCLNIFPINRSDVEKVNIICNTTDNVFDSQERFYSIIKSYITKNCTMKTFYFDQYTLWNYLESMSITHAHLTRLSPVIFNRSLSVSPILYSIKHLNFSHNSLHIINRNFSYYFPSLQKLDLSYNQLVHIRRKTFINLIHLKELYLNNNYLKHILFINFPRQSLRLINLSYNYWHCSCQNVLILSLSRPIPICQTPIQYKNQNAGDIARQCFLRKKANILITINRSKQQNLTCALSSTIDIWKNKTNENITLISAWHIEQNRSISIEYLYALSDKSEKYLICFNLTSIQSESIYTIIPLLSKTLSSLLNRTNKIKMKSSTNQTLVLIKPSKKLPSVLLWIFNTSKKLLPTYFRTSDKQVLIIWLILLTIAFLIFSILIYFIYYRRHKRINYELHSFSNRFIHFHTKSTDPRTIFNMKINCKNHKCLCQYRRRDNDSLIYSTNSNRQPLLIQPTQLRYAKIKRISSTQESDNEYLTGHFRTTVKLKSLPN
ncbi:unnamed protein product [Adineta steineri]|uniref:Uncharacterized protein n=1 Tax=Adineta steineri TaxID=433720 RepID=A0A813ZVQ9_9BILA|nr:unnamed protein product [Adineta steineri]